MLQLEFSQEDIAFLREQRFSHPNAKVRRKLEALYLRSQKVKNSDIKVPGDSGYELVRPVQSHLACLPQSLC
jgi:hypothetical protein